MNELDDQRDAIRAVVHGINAAWREKRYDDIGTLLDENAVVAVPGSDRRVRGRAPYVQSYRDYDKAAETIEFDAGEPTIDVIGDIAVAVCPFSVVYEMDGTAYRERGHDLLVLGRSEEGWRVVWRTMNVEPATG